MIRYFQQQDEDSVIRIWLEASAIAHSFIPRSYWESKVPDMRNEYLPQSQTLVNEYGNKRYQNNMGNHEHITYPADSHPTLSTRQNAYP